MQPKTNLRRLAAAALILVIGHLPAAAAAGPDSAPSIAARVAEALARYRAIAARGGWPEVPPGEVLEPGAADPRVPVLRRRLAASGDLASVGEGARYDPALVDAVRRFQARHGLLVDGRVGRETLAALNVPAAARAETLAINLARWRALPDPQGLHLRVNTAAATLEAIRDGTVVLSMPVIVGAPRTPTPDLESAVTGIVFNPSWTIPHSIAVNEILPRLRRDPGYLAANEIRILDRPADPYGRGIDWRTVSRRAFPFTLRQAPGPRNSLGRIKFDMASPYAIYLHDTPARGLFSRTVRAFSHGCIRLSRALDLAALLSGTERSALEAEIERGETRHLPVAPVPVVVAYLTAFVDVAGEVQFRRDIYRRDRALGQAAASSACGG